LKLYVTITLATYSGPLLKRRAAMRTRPLKLAATGIFSSQPWFYCMTAGPTYFRMLWHEGRRVFASGGKDRKQNSRNDYDDSRSGQEFNKYKALVQSLHRNRCPAEKRGAKHIFSSAHTYAHLFQLLYPRITQLKQACETLFGRLVKTQVDKNSGFTRKLVVVGA
jgi:hypothetical protein